MPRVKSTLDNEVYYIEIHNSHQKVSLGMMNQNSCLKMCVLGKIIVMCIVMEKLDQTHFLTQYSIYHNF